MRYTLRSDADESKFHTLSGMTYPFDGLTIITIMETRIGVKTHLEVKRKIELEYT